MYLRLVEPQVHLGQFEERGHHGLLLQRGLELALGLAVQAQLVVALAQKSVYLKKKSKGWGGVCD